jgi:hypothetical protein
VVIHDQAHGFGLGGGLITGAGREIKRPPRNQQGAGKEGGENSWGSSFHHIFRLLNVTMNRHPVDANKLPQRLNDRLS